MEQPAKSNWSRQLPIAELAPGEVAPPMQPHDASWTVLQDWDDPLAPRAGYAVPAGKERIDTPDGPALEFSSRSEHWGYWDRCLVSGERTWRDYHIRCRLRALPSERSFTMDEEKAPAGRAGLLFRVQTTRRCYILCIEAGRRLVLYRREDEDWAVLAERDVDYDGRIITLDVRAAGNRIEAACPELDVAFDVRDAAFDSGQVGFRSLGRSRLYGLRIDMTAPQRAAAEKARGELDAQVARAAAAVPDPVQIGEMAVEPGWRLRVSLPLAAPDRNDLLFATPDGLAARTWDGRELWRFTERCDRVEFAPASAAGPARIYVTLGGRVAHQITTTRGSVQDRVIAAQFAVLDGGTGRVVGRAPLPQSPPATGDPNEAIVWDFIYEVGAAGTSAGDGEGGGIDFLIKQDHGQGRRHLWAYDRELNLLWARELPTWYGHHNSVHYADVNGDGVKEIVAGGTLLSPDGEVIWVHDRTEEMRDIPGGGHYDAVVMQEPAREAHALPVCFLVAGSAGTYVVDVLTGRTIARHRIGHAQWGLPCRMRPELPGLQCLTGTRWANFGIVTLLTSDGRRLWTIQPDYILQGSRTVRWMSGGAELFWLNTTAGGQGFYDGHGRQVHRLDAVRRLWQGKTAMDIASVAVRRSPTDPVDVLAVTVDGRVNLFAPKSRS